MLVINPYTGRHISTESHRYHDIARTCVLHLTIYLPVKRKKPKGMKDLENKRDPLSTYLREGKYNLAFNHMFRTGESIPSNVIGNVLNELLDYRIFFYYLKYGTFSTYVVSSTTKKDIIKHVVIPRDKHFAILGSFKKCYVIKKAKEALLDRQRLRSEERSALLHKSEINYVKNEATGRMVRVGSRKYNELYPETKRPVGRPSKEDRLDPITDYIDLFN